MQYGQVATVRTDNIIHSNSVLAMKNRKSNRLKGYDYSKNNLYFVTICVQDRLCCFGSVISVGTGRDLSVHHPNENHPNENISMRLNKYGLIVKERIEWLIQQYQYIDVHNFVVMPNHVHLILEIDSLRINDRELKIKSLSSLIGAFKTTSSKLIHE
jgi:putative transposase